MKCYMHSAQHQFTSIEFLSPHKNNKYSGIECFKAIKRDISKIVAPKAIQKLNHKDSLKVTPTQLYFYIYSVGCI